MEERRKDMEKLKKHDHTLTDKLKGLIFALIMLAPLLAVGISSAIMIMNRIMDKLEDFKGNEKFSDDVTLIVLKRVNSKDYIEEI